MIKIALKIASILLLSSALTTTAFATPISNANGYAFRDNEGASPVFTGQGDNFSLGVSSVVPDANNGTTATATNIATGYTIDPLPDGSASLRPGVIGIDIPFADAQNNGWLSSWEVNLTNGADSATRFTPNRTGVQKMEFVQNLSISGTGTSPTVTWKLPTTGAPVTLVSYELWNNDTNQIISGQGPVPLGATAVTVSLSGLQLGTNYAIRILPQQRDASGTVSRSSNWIGWEASDGGAEGTVLELTTGSPAGASQFVDTPGVAFNVEFDYQFTTTTGFLDIFLNDLIIGTRLQAPSVVEGEFLHAVFEVESLSLLNLSGVPLLFQLDGPTGSSILIDNISFPGLLNGDFENGFEMWTAEGQGDVSTRPVPEPATMLLLGVGLLGLAGVRRKFFK